MSEKALNVAKTSIQYAKDKLQFYPWRMNDEDAQELVYALSCLVQAHEQLLEEYNSLMDSSLSHGKAMAGLMLKAALDGAFTKETAGTSGSAGDSRGT